MKNLLNSNLLLISISVIVVCYLISLVSQDFVFNDGIYQKYMDEQYETKYNEYKDLDIDLSDFEEELRQFEKAEEDKGYDWGSFYIDSLFVVVPLLLVTLGFGSTFLILALFHKQLHTIHFLNLVKASLIAYLVFFVPEIISSIYFLVFKRNYELKDVHGFESYFNFSTFFEETTTPKWLWDIVFETGFVYFLFPLIVGLLLGIMYKNVKRTTLVGYSYLAYMLVFVFYNTVFWYLFDLV